MLEHRRCLKLAAYAKFRDRCFIKSGEIIGAVEDGLTNIRLGLAGDDIHHGGLAGAIRPDDGSHLVMIDRERQGVQGAKSVERDRHVVEIE